MSSVHFLEPALYCINHMDLRTEKLPRYSKSYQRYGHPNNAGHQVIFGKLGEIVSFLFQLCPIPSWDKKLRYFANASH